MKRILVLAAAVWLALVAGGAKAELICGPGSLPGKGQFSVGLQGEWLLESNFKDQDAKVTRGAESYSVAATGMKVRDDKSVMARIAYGINDRFSVFAKLGAKNGGEFEFSNWDESSSSWWTNKFKLKSVFAWALGAKARVFETKDGLGMILAAQYQRYDGRKTGDMQSDVGGTSLNDFKADFWQADAAASLYKKLGPISAYAGLGYEHYELKISGRANLGTLWANRIDFGGLKSKDHLNAFAGLGWKATDHLNLTLQGNFIASKAVSLELNWAF